MHRLRTHSAALLAALGVLAACAAPASADPVLAAAGDIACAPGTATSATACQQGATATLISGASPAAVATLGDNQYASGTSTEFSGGYAPTWGAFGSAASPAGAVVHPAPGNHEYDASAVAAGYFGYFGSLAGPGNSGYYSYDIGGWHVVSLNSNCVGASPCSNHDAGDGGVTTAEQAWLAADLDANVRSCTLAYWHHPLFSSAQTPGSPGVKPIWELLYAHHADIVLNGHAHDYERFARQDADGNATAAGIAEFVVGTGGVNHDAFNATAQANSAVRDATHFGALFLTLHPSGYEWAFRAIGGATLDSGSGVCHAARAPSAGPAAPVVAQTAAAPAGAGAISGGDGAIPVVALGVLPPRFTGTRLLGGSVTVRRGRAFVTETSALAATGTLTVTAARHRRIGSARFIIAAGQTKRVGVRLSRAGLALFRRAPRLRGAVIATATDALGRTATTRSSITLRMSR